MRLAFCVPLVALCAAGVPRAADASQFLLVDSVVTHTGALDPGFHLGENGPHCAIKLLPGTPSNWLSPVDYSHGAVYVRIEIMSKPADVEYSYLPIIWFHRLDADTFKESWFTFCQLSQSRVCTTVPIG